MSFSQLAHKIAVGVCVAAATPAVGFAQSGFAPQGGEYAVAASLPGDQVKPRLSISTGGGYVVWQDNITDGSGWGISAQALDSTLAPILSPFRVNVIGKDDQENPQVALLNNGGAVFVWQGGRQGFQHIYARFLSSSNTWLTGDVMVNTSTNNFQINPVVTVLTNGNAVIAYATFSATTMQDVYAQVFSPGGQKIGNEFRVNYTTPFNQRTPAIAALPNGGFVAAWISEQQRVIPNAATNVFAYGSGAAIPGISVDIYARLFDTNGNATSSEFLVNASNSPCANPSVAAGSDGTIMFAWGEKDLYVRNNGWDVFARPFAISGGLPVSTAASERRVNTQLYGDQYAPQIAALGKNYLMIWTSMGQDGDHEGVYGQFLNSDDSASGGEFRVNTTTVSRQRDQAVAADGYGRFLAAWTSFTGVTKGFDLFGQIYANTNLPAPAYLASYGAPVFSAGDLLLAYPDSTPALSPQFLVVGSGTNLAVTNPPPANLTAQMIALAGSTYNGLFCDTNGNKSISSGYFTATTSPKGTNFTAKITLAGTTYSLSANFDQTGHAAKTISRGSQPALLVSLQLSSAGDQIQGTISGSGSWGAALVADRQAFSSTANPAPYAGNYTLVLPPVSSSSMGSGYGTVAIKTDGTLTWNLVLPDGTSPVAQASAISQSGAWPLYGKLSGGREVISWVQFSTNQSGYGLSGQLIWMGPATTYELALSGSTYTAPASGSYALILSGGGLNQSVNGSFQVDSTSKVSSYGGALKTLVAKPSGLFTGSAVSGGTGKPLSFQGVFLNGGAGAGYFLNSGKSGNVIVNQAP